ncbi:MAG: ABC-2 type transporter [candidate division WS6 bacterium GW2011_GWF2_39_15]|uniref:ABC-2 type transporter n=1 Tax=candidate division WS6 bacterium GW2011_GWF2_39_15 TaxID=1619100 RepID=A0A0G0QWV9_9BACT|nr:MAG: ABC-2 type transporter [candidate division WS6 bacterium GW2011_GWF2_39_15]
MSKFWVLLKKEVKELLTPQMIVPFIAMVVVFMLMGNIIGNETEKQTSQKVQIVFTDNDKTPSSNTIKQSMEAAGYEITTKSSAQSHVVIPQNFESDLKAQKQPTIEIITKLDNLSIVNNVNTQRTAQIGTLINELTANIVLQSKLKPNDIAFSKQPVKISDTVKFNNKMAQITVGEIFGYLLSQSTVVPIVLFLVITLASQLVATAIASEKENKTLETLLSIPISRKSIVAAKLMASGVVSFFISILYLYGMKSYMGGLTSTATQSLDQSKVQEAIQQLGLNMGATDYALLGLSLFLGIMVALSFAFILGTFVEDIKSVQGAITPLMVMLLIPYVLTLLLDISTLALPVKMLVYAIPFTHTFTAMNNITLGRFPELYAGMAYMLVIVIVGIIVASKLFSSEKIFTFKLNFFKKSA